MEKGKKERMNDILVKLEDARNSQEALIVKLATIQIELLELPPSELEKAVGEAHSNATRNTEKIKNAIEKHQMAIKYLESLLSGLLFNKINRLIARSPFNL